MHRFIIGTSLTLAAGIAMAFNPCVTNNGQTTCRPGVTSSLQSHGKLNINGTKIEKSLTSHGPTLISDALLSQVTIHGPLTMTDGRVTGAFSVHGPARISGTHISSPIEVYGPFELDGATITGPVYIKGPVNITDATIWQTIDAYASTNKVSDSEIMSLIVHTTNEDEQPVVHLKNCLVQGDIRFIGHTGEVQTDTDTTIYGQITNGTLIASESSPSDHPL